jgi:hypothetical protein
LQAPDTSSDNSDSDKGVGAKKAWVAWVSAIDNPCSSSDEVGDTEYQKLPEGTTHHNLAYFSAAINAGLVPIVLEAPYPQV